MKVTDRLYEAVREIWDGYYQHPFVQGIRDGNLDKEKFRYYILQDYLYLIDYARVFALGAAKSPDLDTMQMFAGKCKSILDNEMSIHDEYMGLFDITQEELDNTVTAIDNASYTAYMLRVGYEEDAAAICSAILACSVSYEILAKRMIKDRPDCVDNPLFGEWIMGYASIGYSDENIELEEFTNRLTADYSEKQYRHLEEIFVNCSRLETAFWDMGWEMKS